LTPEEVRTWMDEGRRARASDASRACLEALAQAQLGAESLDSAHPLVQICAWRRAKAEYDFGPPNALLDALDPILGQEDPFAHYPAGRDGVERLTQRHTDHLGYQDPRLDVLWSRWIDAHKRLGDIYSAEMGAMHLTWIRACRGDLDHLTQEIHRISALSQRAFASSTSRHVDAEDAGDSVFHVQRQVARAVLTGAIWSHDERLGWVAWQLFEDAMEESGADRDADFWYLSTVGRAAHLFGWDEARSVMPPLRRHLSTRPQDVHTALTRGDIDGEVSALLWAADEAIRTHAGFEWAIDAWLRAHRLEPRYRERALTLAEQFGVDVFVKSSNAI
jgi:hypothetical protein